MTISHPPTDESRRRFEAAVIPRNPAPPRPTAPSKNDIRFRVELEEQSQRLDAISSGDKRLCEIGEQLGRVARHLVDRDERHMTVLDRMREATAGIPAASYTPSSSSPPVECEMCDGTGWLSRTPDRKCECWGDRTKADRGSSDQAAADLKALVEIGGKVRGSVDRLDWDISAGRKAKPSEVKHLAALVNRLEALGDAYPPPHRGANESQARALERANIRSAEDCPSCARIRGFLSACRESVDKNGDKKMRSRCEFCERQSKRDPDPENPKWPQIYLVVQHYRDVHEGGGKARLLEPNHADRREMEAWATKHRANPPPRVIDAVG